MANIHELIKTADIDQLKKLIEKNPGAVDEKDGRGFPAIVLATYGQQVEVTQILIDAGVDIDQKDSAGNTALMGVTYKGNEEIAKLLIEAGADVNAANFTNATPLIYAATFAQIGIAKLLLENGADKETKDNKGNSAIDLAKMKDDQGMHDLLTS